MKKQNQQRSTGTSTSIANFDTTFIDLQTILSIPTLHRCVQVCEMSDEDDQRLSHSIVLCDYAIY